MRISRVLPWLAVLFVLPLSHAAQAQSFDCEKAQTDVEWAICNTPQLGKADEDLAGAYRQLLASAGRDSDLGKKVRQLQISWIHGYRDLCGGNVDCLIRAYAVISGAMSALSPDIPENTAQQAHGGIVPDCGGGKGAQENAYPVAVFDKTVCGSRKLLEAVRKIEDMGRKLSAKLPALWRTAFDAQQSAFPRTPYMCPASQGPKLTQCITTAVEQRLKDVGNLAAYMEKPLPPCAPSEITIKDSDVGDAGMSQRLDVYLIEYAGKDACALRGYPAVSVADGKGETQPGYASYSGNTYFSELPGPPLPVVLSPESEKAWFAIHTANACDPRAGPFKVKVALPHSRKWLRTLDFPYAACPGVGVTPIAMISTLLSSVY